MVGTCRLVLDDGGRKVLAHTDQSTAGPARGTGSEMLATPTVFGAAAGATGAGAGLRNQEEWQEKAGWYCWESGAKCRHQIEEAQRKRQRWTRLDDGAYLQSLGDHHEQLRLRHGHHHRLPWDQLAH